MDLDLFSERSHLLLNPKMPVNESIRWERFLSEMDHIKGHVWIATSGSTCMKLVGLSKSALKISAQAVNKQLDTTSQDVWINPLPHFHVGGLGIHIRATLSNSLAITFESKWNAKNFHSFIEEHKGTLSSLVPTQVYDVVMQRLIAPKSLRCVLVGGGRLEESLYLQAKALGWPVVPSYGMTECSSTVAMAGLDSLSQNTYPMMRILSHVEAKVDEDSRLYLKSGALMSCYLTHVNEKPLIHYLESEWFKTEDLGTLSGSYLFLKGRIADFIKIGGESVQVNRLEKILEEVKVLNSFAHDSVLGVIPDERLGFIIHLISTTEQVNHIKEAYDQQVLPFERIRKVHIVKEIPRSSLGKIIKPDLLKLLDL